ncbi:phage-related protein [Bradyrhizobium sp. i1.8.4]
MLIIDTTFGLNIDDRHSFAEPLQMIHRGIEFSVTQLIAGVWKWRFQIGDRVFTGKTEAKLDLLAIRRVQLRIDRELNNLGRGHTRGRSDGD